jgi:hypothetical protein
MTRRKDAQPETPQPEVPQSEPFVTEVESAAMSTAEPIAPDPQPEPPALPAKRPGIFAPLLGGALAAVGGFALSHFNLLGLATPTDLAPLTAQIDDAKAAQATALDKLSGDLTALSDRVATLEAAPGPEAPDLSHLDTLDQRLAAIEAIPAGGNASTAALTAKVAQLEQRLAALPTGGSDPALQQKLDDALARLTEAETAATARASEAEAAAQSAARAEALNDLSDAVATGQPFVVQLQALADPALAEALGPFADSGVPTLASLQEAYPDAARAALRTARDLNTEDGWGDRLIDFLASQTGARSLAPLEGVTPDAILSRVEFALSEGRVADALAETETLDPAVRAPLDPWIAQAKAHLAATAALQAAGGE